MLEACLERHVHGEARVCIGLSGGVDSVVLLDLLVQCLPPTRLSALHVHHGLSPRADAWERFCQELCRQRSVDFRCVRVEVERGSDDGLEGAARRARHAAFSSTGADWVMLAHHADDQAETLLFNLLRGTGLAGAAAMRERNGRLLRPLLGTSRSEIERHARERGLAWCEDESNADARFSRNFLRGQVFPLLNGRFPAAQRNLGLAAARFAEALDMLDDLARLDLGGTEDFPVSIESLRSLEEARARNALRFLLARRGVGIPGESRLREGLRQLLDSGPDRHPEVILGNWRLRRWRGSVYLESASS